MNQRRRLTVRDSHKTTAGKVSVPVLSQFFLQIFLESTKGIYFQTEGSAPAPVSKFGDKSAMCASCETCTTRCPQDVDVAKVMDAVKITALYQGIKPAA